MQIWINPRSSELGLNIEQWSYRGLIWISCNDERRTETSPIHEGMASRSSHCGQHACSPKSKDKFHCSYKITEAKTQCLLLLLWFACQASVWQSIVERGTGECPSARERLGCCSFVPGKRSRLGQIGHWANYCTLGKGSDVMDPVAIALLFYQCTVGWDCNDGKYVWFFCMGGFHLVRDRDGAIDVDQIPLDLSQRGLVSKTMQDNFYQDKHLKKSFKRR